MKKYILTVLFLIGASDGYARVDLNQYAGVYKMQGFTCDVAIRLSAKDRLIVSDVISLERDFSLGDSTCRTYKICDGAGGVATCDLDKGTCYDSSDVEKKTLLYLNADGSITYEMTRSRIVGTKSEFPEDYKYCPRKN